MSRMTTIVITAALASVAAPGYAGDVGYGGYGAVRYGNTSGWLYDNRDDNRGFASNGVFPGDFAAQPSVARIGAGGIAGSTPQRSAKPYPSQVVFNNAGQRRRPGPKHHLGPHALR
jgi:hypothetical protein